MYDGYLKQLPVELVGEGCATLVSCNILERVLVNRLSTLYYVGRGPFRYLDRYQRAADEGGKAQVMKRPKF
jgi:hypothetical protein